MPPVITTRLRDLEFNVQRFTLVLSRVISSHDSFIDLSYVTCVQALVQPLKFFAGTRRVWRCVLVSWVLAAVVAIPQLIVFVQTEKRSLSPDVMVTYKCEIAGYTAEWQRKLVFTFMTLFLLVIPACIMMYCYASIIRVVWLRAGTEAAGNIGEPRVHFVTSRRRDAASDPAVYFAEVGSSDHQPSPHMPRRDSFQMNYDARVDVPRRIALTTKRNVIRMAISVTVGFMVCWTPMSIVTSVRVYSDHQYLWTAAKSISELMALSHSAVNPFLYIIFSTRAVRAAFIHLRQRAAPRCCQHQ